MNCLFSSAQIAAQVIYTNQAYLKNTFSHINNSHKSSEKKIGSNSAIFNTCFEVGKYTATKSVCNFSA